MRKPVKKASDSFDWSRADVMTSAQIHAAAVADPDAQPLTEAQLAKLKPMSRVKLLRVRLRLTQEQFSKRYGIPLTTLRDWEQNRSQPDQASKSYIRAIEAFPDAIGNVIGKRQPEPA